LKLGPREFEPNMPSGYIPRQSHCIPDRP